jgi:hypothetical protein
METQAGRPRRAQSRVPHQGRQVLANQVVDALAAPQQQLGGASIGRRHRAAGESEAHELEVQIVRIR